MDTQIGKLKRMSFLRKDIEGELTLVVSVNGVDHPFQGFETALDFFAKEHRKFEDEGYTGVITTLALPLNAREKRKAFGKHYQTIKK